MRELPFQMAAGSVPGSDHTRTGRNNQDACWVHREPQLLAAVVCDGCGSGARSEVGAQIGARLIARSLAQRLGQNPTGAGSPAEPPSLPAPELWRQVRREVAARLRTLARAMGGPLQETVREYFLFTTVGAVITPGWTALFILGDGLAAVNGQVDRIGPFPGNAPPYLGYTLFPPPPAGMDPALLEFRVLRLLPTAQVDSLLVGTDGVADLMDAADRPVPGTGEPAGPLAQYWRDDRYFTNPDALRRRLAVLSRSRSDPATGLIMPGLLRDDATLVVVRRTRETGS